MKGHKALRGAKYFLAFACLFGAGLLASGALGMTFLDDDPPPPETSSTAIETTTASDLSTSTETVPTSTESAPTSTVEPATTDATSSTSTAAAPTYAPTIVSDKADYSPGSTVTLSGTGWAPNDSVHIFVNDDEGKTWSYNSDVTADANGEFVVQFQLPTTFVATYAVTATGAISGTATTTFTDGNVTLHLTASEGVANMTVTYDRWNGNATCTGTPTLSNQTVSIASSSGAVNIPGFGGNSDSVRLKTVTTTTTGKTFDRWTVGDKNTDLGTLVPGSPTPCISNGSGGTNGNLTDAFAHFITSTATLNVIKNVVNDNGGNATSSAWTMSVTGAGASPSSFTGSTAGTAVTVTPGQTFTVGESGPSGYTMTTSGNCSGPIAAGQTATCTVTNNDQAATLTVIKHVVNDNGGTASASNFTMSVSAGTPSSFAGSETGTAVTINANTPYSVGETGPGGYTRSDSATCASATGLGSGASVTCTVTNNDQAATLTVIKHVINNNGGTATASNFTMSVSGGSPSPATFSGAESPGTSVSLNAGSYSVSETGPSGYTQSLSSDCSGSLAAGQSKTCTVTNDDQAATLTVVKHVVNDNGGTATAANFTMSVPGGSPASFPGSESGTSVSINANTAYSVGESGPSGYTRSDSPACTSATGLAPGANATCTVTNDDRAATLTVIKHVVNNNGGSASAGNFTMTVAGGNPASFAGSETGTQVSINANTGYSVGESGPGGYSRSNSAGCSSTTGLAPGGSATCTVTNDDQAATLTVIKHVINDNGGTAAASAFTIQVNGGHPSPDNFPGAEAGTSVTLDAGSYSVGESGVAGYAGSFSTDCTGTIGNGQSKTCTVTNDDVKPKLIVIKHVVNDNGGSAAAGDFTLSVSGNTPSPGSFPGAEAPGTTVALNAGPFTVSETGPGGYDGSFSADCSSSIAVGETKTCTVTNDDQPATLIVKKHVLNDNGGAATASDFTLSVTGGSPSPSSFAGDESGTSVTLDAGAYSVGETGPAGYAGSNSVDCAGSISNGQTKTCTVTNDDVRPKLIVIKHVINDNGGTKVAGDFNVSVTGGSASPGSFAGAESPGTEVGLNAGSFSVAEGPHAGYALSSSADCSGSIAVGQTKTCTLTNDDVQPVLHVIKHVVNDNGGTASASDFTLNVSGSSPTPGSFQGAEAPGTSVALNAGPYNVGETGPSGYQGAFSSDCSGSIAVGDEKTCTVTNDDVRPKLIVVKHVVNDNGGAATASDFTMAVTGSSPSPASFPGAEAPGTPVGLNAGAYSVGESGRSGYAPSFSEDCTGTIAVGETKTCTVTNDDVPPKLFVVKHVINDNGGTKVAGDFDLSVTGSAPNPASFAGAEAPGTEVSLNAGSYSVHENGPAGYSRSDSADCSGSIAVGETKTCTVTNDDIQPVLHVIKHVINNNGGLAGASDFKLSTGGTAASPADGFDGVEAPGTTVHLNAGSYSVTETGPGGYASSFSDDCSGSLVVGDEKTCTVTNDDIQPKLVVIKHVINDNGGTRSASAFSLTVTGSSPNPASFAGAESPGTEVALNAGSYSAGEGPHVGYSLSSSDDCTGSIGVGQTKTCTLTNDDIQPVLHVVKHVVNDNGGTRAAGSFSLSVTGADPDPANFAGDESGTTVHLNAGAYQVTEGTHSGYAVALSSDCSGSLAVGDEKTCTVTNNDIQPVLHVVKHVVNDNGGTKGAGDFTLNVAGASSSPASFSGDEAGTTVHLNAGSYTVTEGAHSGYADAYSSDCSGSIDIGEEKSCTVTNDDIQPKLIVIKHVVNDNGGTKAAAGFNLSVTGPAAAPASFGGAEAPGTEVALNAGAYSVSEGAHPGYALTSSAACSGSIAVGETKTCTLTNDDIQPKLIVVKHVVNDNGGTAGAGSFTMSVTGDAAAPASFPGADTPGTTVGLNAGNYSVSETGQSGYAESDSADCTGSIDIGQTKTCTITNNDIQPKLFVIKHVVNDNGGSATATSFTMTVTGSSPNPSSFAGADSPGTDVAINAGSYSVSEAGPTGYAQSFSADCTGSLTIGQTKTCTVTNDDIQPKLIVIKHVINDDGGPKSAADFTMQVTGSSPSPASFPGAEAPGTTVAINAGSYSVDEAAMAGYAKSFSADCSGSLSLGQTKTCTITNNDVNQPPVITVFTGTNSLAGPLVFMSSSFSGTFTDSAVADNPWILNWSWDGAADPATDSIGANGTTTHNFGPRTHTYATAGCTHTATVKVTDKDGAFDTKTVTVQVGTGGFLPPMTNQPVTNKLKNGQVLPVKIQIVDCTGAGVNNLVPAIRLVEGDQTTTFDDGAVTITPDSVSNADTTGVMRSSGSDGSYMYNMRVSVPANKIGQDYTVVIYPYGTAGANANLTLRHVIVATK